MTRKILRQHLAKPSEMNPGDEIYLQSAGVNAKEVILEMLRRETIKGGLGKVYEYFGPGALSLSVPERQTITNMGAEMGATTSIFPADERVREFLRARGRFR